MQNNLKRKNPDRRVALAIRYFSTQKKFDLVSFNDRESQNTCILVVSPVFHQNLFFIQ